ncbi:MAG: hypothetical protein KBT01_05295 [Clostridiales bacterium]|nr:hypothetical protein [Candidatus Blautia equi]
MGLLEEGVKNLVGKGISDAIGQGLGSSLLGGNLQGIVEMIISKLKQNISIPDIAKQVKQPENIVSQISEVANQVGLDANVEQIIAKLVKLPDFKK